MKLRFLGAAVVLALSSAAPVMATPTFVNGLTIPANTTDLSGDPNPINQRLGMFSDIYYDRLRNEWWALGDRGAGGGTLPYDTRVQRFTIDVNSTTGAISNFKVVQTIEFTGPLGNFNGLAPFPTNVLGRALDPEGIVINPGTGRFLVSDEYGPSLYEFNRDGTLNRAFTTPPNLIPRNGVTKVPNFADDTGNTAGRRTNRGFEGLAITPDGKFSFAMLQSPMLDEGGLGNGRYNRIVKFDNATGQAVAQYAYLMEGSSQGRGISSLVALNDHEFLVLERNNRGVGVASDLSSPNKKVFKIDITGASDVTDITLPDSGPLPGGRMPVTKNATPFFSLDAVTIAAFGGRVPEKLEGLAIGPRLDDGQYLILAGTDNDFSITQLVDMTTQFDVYYNPTTGDRIQCDLLSFANCLTIKTDGTLGDPFNGPTAGFDLIPGLLYAFKTNGSDLVDFVPTVPLPATWAMLLAGLGLLTLTVRRRHA